MFLVVINYELSQLLENTKDIHYIHCNQLQIITDSELQTLVYDISGVILTGGPQHIPEIEKHPELQRELKLIAYAVEQKCILLGICLGFQLLNYFFGNRVITLPNCIIGFNKMNPMSVNTYGDPVLQKLDFTLLCSGFSFHYDGVVENMNPDLYVVATGPNKCIYFIKHRYLPIYGIQSHPELSSNRIEKCIQNYNITFHDDLPVDSLFTRLRTHFVKTLLGINDMYTDAE